MTLDPQLLEIIRCPACRGTFAAPTGNGEKELSCTGCGNVYPVRNGVPVLLVDEARTAAGGASDSSPLPTHGG